MRDDKMARLTGAPEAAMLPGIVMSLNTIVCAMTNARKRPA